MSKFVIPDSHGCLSTLKLLIENKLKISITDTVFFLGDYIDRGPKSAELIEYLISKIEDGYNWECLKGNHEQLLLDAFKNQLNFQQWMLNSGDSTLYSYAKYLGIEHLKMHIDLIPERHLNFLKSLPIFKIIDDKFILIHGFLDYREANPFANDQSILWKRPESIPDWFLPNKIIIHGHTPIPLNYILNTIKNPASRVINLDAGCVYKGYWAGTGYLTALNLDTMEITYTENID